MSFGTDFKAMYLISTRPLPDNIAWVHVQLFKFLTLGTQTILHIKIWLSCVLKYIVCGKETKIWNYKSGRIA